MVVSAGFLYSKFVVFPFVLINVFQTMQILLLLKFLLISFRIHWCIFIGNNVEMEELNSLISILPSPAYAYLHDIYIKSATNKVYLLYIIMLFCNQLFT